MTTLLIALATVQWMVFTVLWLMRRKPGERGLVWSTVIVAATWFAVAHFTPAAAQPPAPATPVKRGCAGIHSGMNVAALRTALGDPTRVASEGETQGPGAEAWVYEDRRCVVRMLDGLVWSVEAE